jgi:hypothetical protein
MLKMLLQMSRLPHYKALHDSLVSFYFWLCQVSLAEYLLVLRVLFSHLLQMGRCTTAIVSTAFTLRWVMLRTMGNGRSLRLI